MSQSHIRKETETLHPFPRYSHAHKHAPFWLLVRTEAENTSLIKITVFGSTLTTIKKKKNIKLPSYGEIRNVGCVEMLLQTLLGKFQKYQKMYGAIRKSESALKKLEVRSGDFHAETGIRSTEWMMKNFSCQSKVTVQSPFCLVYPIIQDISSHWLTLSSLAK